MSEEKVPNELRYTKSHEWVKVEGDTVTVGITDHAQGQLTDIVFVDLPATGKAVTKGGSVLSLESVKTVADVYAPANGTVVAANTELKTHPEYINQDPYGKGWIYRLRVTGAVPTADFLTADQYRAFAAASSG